jgi:hypothetical protein
MKLWLFRKYATYNMLLNRLRADIILGFSVGYGRLKAANNIHSNKNIRIL